MSSTPDRVLNFIDGSFVAPASESFDARLDPGDRRRVVADYPLSTEGDVHRAVAAAAAAQPAWASQPILSRVQALREVIEAMRASRDEFATAITSETGKPIRDAAGEIDKSLVWADFFLAQAMSLSATGVQSGRPRTTASVLNEPIGVAGLITPWNFPMSSLLRKLVPALLMGNAVVVKPAEQTPLSPALLAALISEASRELRPAVNIVYGLGATVGGAIAADERVGVVSFTGSAGVGRQLIQTVAGSGRKLQCETGGKNATVVMPDADTDAALQAVTRSAFGCSGQWCAATSRAFIHERVLDEYVRGLRERVESLRIGPGTDRRTDVGPLVTEEHRSRVLAWLTDEFLGAGEIVTGGKAVTDGQLAHGNFMQPTLIANVAHEQQIAQQEIFGPVLTITPFTDLEQAISMVNSTEYGFVASIFTAKLANAERYTREVECGRVNVNLPTVYGEPQMPSKGRKRSGFGPPESGSFGLEFFSEPKSILMAAI